MPNASLTVSTYIVVVVLDGLSCKVEYSPGYDALTDEVADFKVCGEDGLRVFILSDTPNIFPRVTKTVFEYSLLQSSI